MQKHAKEIASRGLLLLKTIHIFAPQNLKQ
jgi:hypothetical protein